MEQALVDALNAHGAVLTDSVSFFAGVLTAIAFVIAATHRW
jgi:hypothetical protein